MKAYRWLSLVLAIILMATLLAGGCSAGPTETRDDSFTVDGPTKLVVNTDNGSIEINAGADDEVRVEATLRGADKIDYEVSQDGNTITVEARIGKSWWNLGNIGADITITAPAKTDVELDTSNGPIELQGIEGSGDLRTSNGKIVLKDVKGDFEGRTSNGRVEIDTMEGTGTFRTSNGEINLLQVTGEFDADTSNGRISFVGKMTAGGSNRLITSNGSVNVDLWEPASVSLDAKTSNGDITSEPPITATVTEEDHLVGTIGGGDADLYIRTSNGDVTIKEVAAPEPQAPDYSAITEELAQLIQGAMDGAGVTGLSVALVDDQEMVWAEGFGYADKENGVEATPETVYQVASISKLFTAAAIMQLVEEGEIDIDQPLQTYVPEFSVNSRFPDAGPITPRDVMTHHSGLPSDWLNGMFAYGDDQEALVASEFGNLVSEIKDAYVTNPPNTAFSYSNLGYALLGQAMEQVTGEEFSDYVDEAILEPMGMDSSSFTLTPDMKQLLSKEYLKGEEQEYIWVRDIPAGSLRSNVEDMSRFMMMVFGDGEVGGQRILRAETVAEMLSPQNSDVPLDFDARWGLGWWLLSLGLDYAGKTAWHSGGEGMWNSLLVTLPEHKLGVVVLSNSGEAGGAIIYQIATTILEQALEVKAGIGRPSADPPDVVSLSTDELLSYVGSYTTDLGWMNIRSDGTDLYADVMGQSFKLLPHGEGRFSIEGISWSDAQVAIKVVNGRTALKLYGFAIGGLGFGERLLPATISEAWMNRVGFYEITNGKPGFLTFLSDVQLKYENDFLVLDVTRSDTGDQIAFPVGPLSDDKAIILGLGLRLRGETISVVDVDGEEQLYYSGYLMRKLGPA